MIQRIAIHSKLDSSGTTETFLWRCQSEMTYRSDAPTTTDHALSPLERFRAIWEERDRPDLAGFVSSLAQPVSQRLLIELVKADIDLRWRSGRGQQLESYLELWPELLQSSEVGCDLLKSEFLSRGTYHTPPSREELARRFPDLCGTLVLDDLIRQAKLRSQRESFEGTGRFFLVRQVGVGGMGEVYAALDRERQAIVAVKTLRTSHPERLYRFKHEFRALAEIVHRRLVPLYELVSTGNRWFFTMELVDGVDLLSYFNPQRSPSDAETQLFFSETGESDAATDDSTLAGSSVLNPALIQGVFRQLAEGLMALHEAGILHRDIKPSNVLVRGNGDVIILDFGLIAVMSKDGASPLENVSLMDSSSASLSDPYRTQWSVVGTAAYMSPEQAMGRALTPSTDWYSLGVMLFRVLTGKYPFSGSSDQILYEKRFKDPPSPFAISEGVPSQLGQLCEQLLCRDPVLRPSGEEVLARLNADSSPAAIPSRVPVSREAPFVGRHKPLRQLQMAFDEMRRGTPVVADVSGASGIGKSRLIRHFLEQISRQYDPVVLQGRCYERESMPYKALDLLIDSLCRFLGSLPRAERNSLLPPDTGALLRLFPVLQGVEPFKSPTDWRQVPEEAQEVRQEATRAFSELLKRIGHRYPLVLWIDDLQWDDADSAVVLSAIIQQASAGRLLLIVSFRSEQANQMVSLAAIDQALEEQSGQFETCLRRSIELGPLDRGESEELARQLLSGDKTDMAVLIENVAQQSRGTPYFIQELVRYAALREGPAFSSDTLPQLDLQDVLHNRVKRLETGERALLEVVAVAGRPIKLLTAYRAAGLDSANRQVLVSLCAAHLLRTTGPKLDDEADVFHDHLRSSVLSLLAEESLRTRHARLATVLEDDHDDSEMIASHFHHAGQLQKAVRYYTHAAERAAEALAFQRAARLYQTSIDLSNSTDPGLTGLTLKLADALANAGRGRQAADAYLQVAATVPAEEARELRRRAAYHYCASGHIAQGRNEFATILAEVGMRLPRSPRTAIVSCLWRRMLLRVRGLGFRVRNEAELTPDETAALDISWSVSVGLTMIDTIHAADYQALNLLQALRAGEPYRLVRALAWQASHIATAGLSARGHAQRLLDVAESIISQVEKPHGQGLLTISRGVTAFFQGEWAKALARCDEAEEILRERCTGVAWERATARSFALWSLYFLGNTSELMHRQPELLREARQRGDLLAEASLTNLSGSLMWLSRDRPEEARAALKIAMQPWEGLGFRTQHFTSLASHVQIDLYCGEPRAAFLLLESKWPELRRSMLLQIEAIRIYMWHLRGCCAAAAAGTGLPSRQFVRLARRCAKRLAKERADWAVALGRLIRAALADLAGQRHAAAALLAVAASQLEEAQMNLYAAAARYRQGELLGGEVGRTLVDNAVESMAAQNIRDCDAMANMYVPRFRKP